MKDCVKLRIAPSLLLMVLLGASPAIAQVSSLGVTPGATVDPGVNQQRGLRR